MKHKLIKVVSLSGVAKELDTRKTTHPMRMSRPAYGLCLHGRRDRSMLVPRRGLLVLMLAREALSRGICVKEFIVSR
jgi:hypothetical protein